MEHVHVLHWPRDWRERQELARRKALRLLLVQGAADPPMEPDFLEDWVRVPGSTCDLQSRLLTLRERGRAWHVPRQVSDRVLRFRDQSIPLSARASRVAGVLVESFGEPVSRETLQTALGPAQTRAALDLQIMHLRRRLEPLGLQILTVRGTGYLLTLAAQEPDQTGHAQAEAGK